MNRKLAVLAICFGVLSQSGLGQTQVSETIKKELVAAESEMFKKIVQLDPDYMKNLVADDYFSINADGST